MKDFKPKIIIIFNEQNIFNEQRLQTWKFSIMKQEKKKEPNENSGTQKYDSCNAKNDKYIAKRNMKDARVLEDLATEMI